MTTLRAVFAGINASSANDLWVTDGTTAGTSDLTVIGASTGFSPNGFTALSQKLLFAGTDASGNANLWITNGTAAGTIEPNVVGIGPAGLQPSGFTLLGNKVLFHGLGFANPNGSRDDLWITDGTAAGTIVLNVANAGPGGLDPLNLTVLGNKALFAGTDAASHVNLWITDGTAGGTVELTVAGASSAGLLSNGNRELVTLGNKVLFNGLDSAGRDNLWVSDGTGAGTVKLTVTGTNAGGFFANDLPFITPLNPHFTLFGSKVLFVGLDNTGDPSNPPNANLWITDGTGAGTKELLFVGSSFGGLLVDDDPDFTVVGTKVLFNGADASGLHNLFVTDGVTVSELQVPGVGVGVGLNPQSLTLFGNKVLFDGIDANNHSNLWITDGTVNGTSELNVTGANSLGLFTNDPVTFTVLGNKVLFNGLDAGGRDALWVTDGTAAGTVLLNPAGQSSGGLHPSSISALPTSRTDFNGDGHSDILFQNTNGAIDIWLLNGVVPTTETFVQAVDPTWHAITAADFNGDGDADILFQNTNGAVAIWTLSGAVPTTETLVQLVDPSWHVIAAGDFNNDGKADILFQNTNGAIDIWLLNGVVPISETLVQALDPTWHAIGVGDFNNDGKADIVFQNTNGAVAIWLLNGAVPISETFVQALDPSWHVIGTGDFSGDGKADLLFQNTNGSVAIWTLNGAAPTAENLVQPLDPSWKAIGSGDYNFDGRADILFQNSNGSVAIWTQNSASPVSETLVQALDPSWQVKLVG